MTMRPRIPARLEVALGAIAATAVVRGIGYLGHEQPPKQLMPLETVAPFWVYSLVWFAAGALAAAAIVTNRAFNTAISINTALWALWGCSYLIAYITQGTGRSYMTGAVFLLIAVLIYHTGRTAQDDGNV